MLSLYFPVASSKRVRGAEPAQWNVEVTFPSIEVAVHEALGWETQAVAVGPPELRERLGVRVRALAERYA